MADKQGNVKRKESTKKKESLKPQEKAKAKESSKPQEKAKAKESSKPQEKAKAKESSKTQENPKPEENAKPLENTKPEENSKGSEDPENPEDKVELMELPPFEVITGDRISSFFFKFQFRNVEYSSGRNKTFLCYSVDIQGGGDVETLRGYLEDEHITAPHAEEAFFTLLLPECKPELRYHVTWYVSSSPCVACAAKIAEVLRSRKDMRLTIMVARLFMWEEPEIQEGLRQLKAAGCKLKIMKPADFVYTWDTYVEPEGQTFTPWVDAQENYEYYDEKLSEILQ
ncbi:C-_U-editing enzyme APOBEC-2-like isoform X1 [Acipenser oxyrinchus oxyrinchus]|uniref:C->U-editing enzyme APOBEC-2-like isoform X1 n=1 Tax=Acipenser oxyrinchus oxyrinchus TaxID=40147 RepID=A0AAD8CIS8_ACIOX|nr:C->U-editing enzyme APOBEC-2-like isoform X1 [Acipenser oxyrinchus oxyrinchus]